MTKDNLLSKLKQLEEDRDNAWNMFQQTLGAIEFCRHLLGVIEKEEERPSKPVLATVTNQQFETIT